MNLADVLGATAARHGERPALTDVATGRCLRYRDVLAAAERTAALLRDAGVRPAERVALVAGNTLMHVPTAFGILAAGAVLVPVAPTLRPAELEAVLDETDVGAVARLEGDTPALAWTGRRPRVPEAFAALAPAFVRFTSGTTATRKGVILGHDAVLARVAAADAVLGLTPADRVLWTLPLAYHFAVTIVAYVRAGAHVLLASEALPAALVDAAAAHGATLLYGSPMQFARMAASGRRVRLPGVRVALSTTAALPAETAAAFEAVFDVPLGQAYGIIEAGLPCIETRRDGGAAESVGRPVPGYGVAVLDEAGRPRAPGSEGEVVVRGPGLFDGYYRPWTPRDVACPGGWFHTGDVGVVDAAGRLRLRGRTKSVISVAGMKVFPEEVEACLNRVAGVLESRVVGRPHPRLGEVPCAEVVADPSGPPPDPRTLARACADTLSTYKVPVEFRIVPRIPKTPGGKISRRPAGVSPDRG